MKVLFLTSSDGASPGRTKIIAMDGHAGGVSGLRHAPLVPQIDFETVIGMFDDLFCRISITFTPVRMHRNDTPLSDKV